MWFSTCNKLTWKATQIFVVVFFWTKCLQMLHGLLSILKFENHLCKVNKLCRWADRPALRQMYR